MPTKPGFFCWRDYILFALRAAGMSPETAEQALNEYRDEVLKKTEGH